MSIEYTYEVVSVDSDARCMEIVYSSPGQQSLHVGARLPYEGETLDQIAAMYAPLGVWVDAVRPVVLPQVGATGGSTPPVIDLATAKALKLAEIAAARYAFETGGVGLGGITYSTDRQTQATITGALVGMSNGMLQSIDWKANDTQWVTLSLAQMQELAQTVAGHVQSSFSLEKTLAAQVSAAETIEAVQAIGWPQ